MALFTSNPGEATNCYASLRCPAAEAAEQVASNWPRSPFSYATMLCGYATRGSTRQQDVSCKTGSTKLKITYLLPKCTQKTGEWWWMVLNPPESSYRIAVVLLGPEADVWRIPDLRVNLESPSQRTSPAHTSHLQVCCLSQLLEQSPFHSICANWRKTYTNIICIETVPVTKGSCSQNLYFCMCSVDLCGTAYCKFTIPKSKTWTPKSPKCRKFHGKLQVWAVLSWWNPAQSPCTACRSPCATGAPAAKIAALCNETQQRMVNMLEASPLWCHRHMDFNAFSASPAIPVPSENVTVVEENVAAQHIHILRPPTGITVVTWKSETLRFVSDWALNLCKTWENQGLAPNHVGLANHQILRLVDDLAAPASIHGRLGYSDTQKKNSSCQWRQCKTRRLGRLWFHHARSCCDVLAACPCGKQALNKGLRFTTSWENLSHFQVETNRN